MGFLGRDFGGAGTNLEMEEDSDSAPEDIAFGEAKNDALEQMKIVSSAAKQKKELRKEANKRRQKALADQKESKAKKLKYLVSKKLPDFILDTLNDEELVPEKKKINLDKMENSKITFSEDFVSDDENGEDGRESEDYIALETDITKFKVVTSRDLHSSKFKSSEAFNFREKMLFGSRVKREPYKAQAIKREKLRASGKGGKVGVRS